MPAAKSDGRHFEPCLQLLYTRPNNPSSAGKAALPPTVTGNLVLIFILPYSNKCQRGKCLSAQGNHRLPPASRQPTPHEK
jgi:hypothetical protein